MSDEVVTQIRLIVDRGASVICPICSVNLSSGLGHLCRRLTDGATSGQTWNLQGGLQITPKESRAPETTSTGESSTVLRQEGKL